MTTPGETPGLDREGAPAFRDLGGTPVDGGCIAPRRLYRSEALTTLTAAGVTMQRELGIRLRCDLRSPMERERFPVTWPDPVPRALQMPDDVAMHATAERHVRAMYTAANGEQARRVSLAMYADMHRLFAETLRDLFAAIADGGELPVLVHCSAGKDRTGFVTAMLLFAAGCSEETAVAEYLAIDRVWGIEKLRATLREHAGRDAPQEVLEAYRVQAAYLRHSIDAIRSDHGSIAAYLREAGLDDARRRRLRDALVVPVSR